MVQMRSFLTCLVVVLSLAVQAKAKAASSIDFSRQIRPILSENCFFCHGPDEKKRKAGLRLDDETAAKSDNDGVISVVPGDPEKSALFQRIISSDPDEVMPPPKQHKTIPPDQVALLRQWIEEGAAWGNHWSYEPVKRPKVPSTSESGLRSADWKESTNPIDAFLAKRLGQEGLEPTSPADAAVLLRRIALDLTGLPPSLDELARFSKSVVPHPESAIDHFLAKPAYGEHWARQWLDLARYADSSGYPSDQPREIWAYRDWVIDSLNANMPFDRFTIDQLAGDLLPNPTDDQLIATAFHRNTMTQNEGGTNDEEFRVAAIVDRVNTTMAVWMGTTMACAQCHTHKYDPITHHEYYAFYDFLNQTADADKKDEAPLHSFYTEAQKAERTAVQSELDSLQKTFAQPGPEVWKGLATWEQSLPLSDIWTAIKPTRVSSTAKTAFDIDASGKVFAAEGSGKTDTYSVELPLKAGRVEGLRLEALANERLPKNGPGHANGNFVLSQVRAEWIPDDAQPPTARFVRIEKISDKYDFLALAEVQVFSGETNIAMKGTAKQNSTFVGQPEDKSEARLAIDGNTDGNSAKTKSVSITAGGDDQWWELDLGAEKPVDRIVLWKRTDKGQGTSIQELKITLLDASRGSVWEATHKKKEFATREEVTVSGRRELQFRTAFADTSQSGFNPADVVAAKSANDKGWAMAGHTGADHSLTVLPLAALETSSSGRLLVKLSQTSKYAGHTLGAFRLSTTADARVSKLSAIPPAVLAALSVPEKGRTAAQTKTLRDHYTSEVAPELKSERQRRLALEKQLASIKPVTIPIMKEVPADQKRESHVQLRGDWQSLGDKVSADTPAAFPPLPPKAERNRLTLAKWLVSRDNPLTARVMVNRLWESIFGVGIVQTSEEFGSQGELPVHPELLDWLAAEFMDSGWDVQHMLRLMLTSRAYRQDSATPAELNQRDPDNRLLARGPRFRPTGELLRDQALAVSGLLSTKIGGPPVRPLAPKLGLKAAFGRANDWITSEGEDRHRRSIYTEVMRNSPYASFMTFDGVNREVCTIRRNRTNTPLQAFVTLNDPVFIETNQAMARRLVREGGPTIQSRLRHAFQLCVARDPSAQEAATLTQLFNASLQQFKADPAAAEKMATDPLGPAPEGTDLPELAAWATVANVIMNLDEFLMRR